MSIATSGIGNNPATESRIAYDYATAARSVKAAVTGTGTGTKTSAKKTETKSVQSYSAKELRYNMNEQLDQVVVTVVDPSTNKIIKEIPSAEVQEMKIRVKNAIGSFIDETR